MATAPIDPNAPQYAYIPPQPGTVDNNQSLPASQQAGSTQQTTQATQTQTTAAPKATSESKEVENQPPPPPPPPAPTYNTSGQLTGTTISTTA